MKNIIRIFAVIALIAFSVSSCKDENQAPVIRNLEVGYDNSKTAVIGSDLHLEASILADAKIAKIIVSIHTEDEAENISPMKINTSMASEGWKVDSIYTTKYEGVKNADFHEHIEVPLTAAAGNYHLHFTVVDMDGNATEVESQLTLITQK